MVYFFEKKHRDRSSGSTYQHNDNNACRHIEEKVRSNKGVDKSKQHTPNKIKAAQSPSQFMPLQSIFIITYVFFHVVPTCTKPSCALLILWYKEKYWKQHSSYCTYSFSITHFTYKINKKAQTLHSVWVFRCDMSTKKSK